MRRPLLPCWSRPAHVSLGLAAGQADAAVAGLAAGIDGRCVASSMPPGRSQLVQADDPGRLARFEVRLAQIEEELRQLTGRIEQLEYGQRTLERPASTSWSRTWISGCCALEQAAAAGARRRPAPATRQAPAPSAEQHRAEAPRRRPARQGLLRTSGRSAPCRRARCRTLPRPDPGGASRRRRQRPSCRRSSSTTPRWSCCAPATTPGAKRPAAVPGSQSRTTRSRPTPPTGSAETYYVRKDYPPRPRRSPATTAPTARTRQGAGQSAEARHVAGRRWRRPDKACQTYAELAKEFPERARPDPAGSDP